MFGNHYARAFASSNDVRSGRTTLWLYLSPRNFKMDPLEKRVEVIIAILNSVLDDSLDPKLALQRWPNIDEESSSQIKRVWFQLRLYATDSDIRSREPEYEESLKKRLRARIEDLKKLSSKN